MENEVARYIVKSVPESDDYQNNALYSKVTLTRGQVILFEVLGFTFEEIQKV